MTLLSSGFSYLNGRAQTPNIADYQCEPPEEFQTMGLSDPELMKIIERLQHNHLGHLIPLPQIVVVGDQNSGKSSVLEAITKIPFPRENGLCTRFATQINLHMSRSEEIKVSIRPSFKRKVHERVALEGFKKVLPGTNTLEPKQFLEILEEASNLMGVTGPNKNHEKGKKSFSDDVLKIDYSGPKHENLSIIDVPGIFRNPQEGVTTDDDMELVRTMVDDYIKGERTIILAVLPANADFGIHEILPIAKIADPKGQRTLGVFTKPDLVQKGDEKDVIDILQGKSNQLALGYYVVCNLRKSQLDDLAQSRDETERNFFATSPWTEVDKDHTGITSLKTRLRDLLKDITRREFPKIKAEIKKQLTAAENSLDGMGKDRVTPGQQKKFLEDIAMKFQGIRHDVMATLYHKHDILEDYALRLPTLVAYRNDLFLKDMKSKGHFVHFEKGADDSDNEEELATTEATKGLKDLNLGAVPIQKISYDILEVSKTFPELQDLLESSEEISPPSQTDIKEWIKMEYCAARNFELDLVSPSILHLLWKRQSGNWESIARKYIYDIIFYVHRFIFLILRHVCPDERTFGGLKDRLVDELLRRYHHSIHQVTFNLEVERLGSFITKNHHYARVLKKLRIERIHKETKKLVADLRIGTSGDGNPREESAILHDYLTQAGSSQSSFEHVIDDTHDILMAYYKVASKRFIDIVIAQAADYYLLTGSESPLNILTHDFINEMSNEQREIIAGEDMVSKKKRDGLRDRIDHLKKGKSAIEGLKG